jgi:2-polyprenyl-3-methyl-5-hydroxy-6-metoxy-1,4-benzoquinol methylase
MSLEDHAGLDRFDRERREADERYNAALTDLDRAVVAADGHELARDDFDRIRTALVVFLQQITAFVESKDRQVAAVSGARLESIEQSLSAVSELRTQIGVLTRAIEALRGLSESAQSAASPNRSPRSAIEPQSAIRDPQSAASDYKYVAFEDQFRGSSEAIGERLRAYLPIFAGRANVLDVGCGRGEFLAALKAAGITARGIDANANMVAVARDRGLEATQADALAGVRALPDASLGGLIATQVVEHLEPSYLMALLDAAAAKLQPGAPIVLETINAACWLAFFSSYIRDFTHVRPVHPETLQYLLRASGFERVEIRYSAAVPEQMKMKTVDLPVAILTSAEPAAVAMAAMTHTINANAVILNNLMFTHLDYAAVGYRI